MAIPVGTQNAAIRILTLPDSKREFVHHDAPKLLSLEGTLDSRSRDLLPPRTGFVIAHDEVLIIDASQMKMKLLSIHDGLPHDTGVAQRSVSRRDRRTSNNV